MKTTRYYGQVSRVVFEFSEWDIQEFCKARALEGLGLEDIPGEFKFEIVHGDYEDANPKDTFILTWTRMDMDKVNEGCADFGMKETGDGYEI